jgi:hypothetical protein
MEWANGSRSWWVEGKLHRVDGPAMEWANGGREWRVEGELHRVDGPAYERADGGYREWYLNGKFIKSEGEFVKSEHVKEKE